ncbi:MAG: preprotein translocase subunit SecG [Bacillota bacterium]
MLTLLKIVHFIVAIGVIAGVLLQSGKSAGMSGVIDGGATQIFGKKKGLDDKIAFYTKIVAIIFGITSLVLALLY